MPLQLKQLKKHQAFSIIACGVLLLGFQNCAPTSFNTTDTSSVASAAAGNPVITPATTSCSLDSSSSGTCDIAKSFVGSLYIQPRPLPVSSIAYQNGSQVGATSVEDYLSHPEWIAGTTVNGAFTPYTISLSSINSLNNSFANGFTTQSGDVIKIADGSGGSSTVPNWFALDLFANFHLDGSDTAGDYQVAIIADDGAEILYKPVGGSGTYQMLVDDQVTAAETSSVYIPGTQYARMGCSSVAGDTSKIVTISMKAASSIPLEVRYYNGPQGLNFRLMYRKVPAGGAVDNYCETDTNGNAATKPTIDKASPILDPSQLSDWKVMSSTNLGN